MKKLIPIIAVIFSILPMSTFAHEGHGLVETGPVHFLISLEHVLPFLVVGAIAVFLIRKKIFKRT